MYEIQSSKNVSEIVSSLRTKGYQLDMVPSEISNGVRSSFSAVLHGSGGGMLGSRNEPGVKIAIYDSGDIRKVVIEALSTSPMGQKFNLKKGEQLCEQLYSELNEGRAIADIQTGVFEPEPEPVVAKTSYLADEPASKKQTEPKNDDFASKFMKGFKDINSSDANSSTVSEPTIVTGIDIPDPYKEAPTPAYVKPSVTADNYSESVTWRCDKCGKINIGEARFCGECGAEKPGTSPSHSGMGETPKPVPPKPPINKAVIIIAAVVVIALIVGIPLINKLTSVPSYDDSYYADDYDDSSYDESYDDSEAVDEEYYDEEYPDNGDDPYFVIGNTYQIQTNLRVREGPGKEYRILNRDELAYDDYMNSVDSNTTTDALMEKGKYVTCLGMEGNWMKIESGWICVYDEGEDLVR